MISLRRGATTTAGRVTASTGRTRPFVLWASKVSFQTSAWYLCTIPILADFWYTYHMTERELLEHALEAVKGLGGLLEQAYQKHDHDSDLIGGALLSSARMFTKAIQESIIAIILHISNTKGTS